MARGIQPFLGRAALSVHLRGTNHCIRCLVTRVNATRVLRSRPAYFNASGTGRRTVNSAPPPRQRHASLSKCSRSPSLLLFFQVARGHFPFSLPPIDTLSSRDLDCEASHAKGPTSRKGREKMGRHPDLGRLPASGQITVISKPTAIPGGAVGLLHGLQIRDAARGVLRPRRAQDDAVRSLDPAGGSWRVGHSDALHTCGFRWHISSCGSWLRSWGNLFGLGCWRHKPHFSRKAREMGHSLIYAGSAEADHPPRANRWAFRYKFAIATKSPALSLQRTERQGRGTLESNRVRRTKHSSRYRARKTAVKSPKAPSFTQPPHRKGKINPSPMSHLPFPLCYA